MRRGVRRRYVSPRSRWRVNPHDELGWKCRPDAYQRASGASIASQRLSVLRSMSSSRAASNLLSKREDCDKHVLLSDCVDDYIDDV
jgi:hypothetical protein